MEKKLGVEIEFTGVKRSDVVTALEFFFHTDAINIVSKTAEDGYEYHKLIDQNKDTWLVVRDRSIKPEVYMSKLGGVSSEEDAFETILLEGDNEVCLPAYESPEEYMVELVSPALTSKSLPTLFSIIDIIKSLGGIVNYSCGLHVHIDKPDNLSGITTLFKRFYLDQKNILEHFNVNREHRLGKYCKPYNDDLNLDILDEFTSEKDFLDYLYKQYAEKDDNGEIIRKTLRYYALNFHSIVVHNTIEFRLFNSTLNRVEIAKILDWVLHFVYTSEEYNSYIPVLGGILMNEIQVEV